MANNLYYISSFIGKTLQCAKSVPVYSGSSLTTDSKPDFYLQKGTSTPVIYSYLEARPDIGRMTPFLEIPWGNDVMHKYVPLVKGYFDKSFFEEVGILTVKQVDSKNAAAVSTWDQSLTTNADGSQMSFTDMVKHYGTWAVGIGVGLVTLKVVGGLFVDYLKK